MKKALPYFAVVGAALVCIAGLAMSGVAVTALGSASDARQSAQALYEARAEVARLQEGVGGSNLDEAVAGAQEANRSAITVREITRRIAELLHETRLDAEIIGRSSQRGVSAVTAARRQAVAAADSVNAISAYQRASASSTRRTNGALLRILRALRETNESFGGPR